MIKSEVLVPLLNANEPEARLVAIHVREGQQVEKGMVVFTMETTKAAADVESPESGHIRILAQEGDTFSVGDKLAVITETADELFDLPKPANPQLVMTQTVAVPENIRMTKPARVLAEKLGVDWSKIPVDRLVTEAMVREIAGQGVFAVTQAAQTSGSDQRILIYGGGGHAKAVMEMIEVMGTFTIAGIIDDRIPAGTRVLDIPVIGTRDVLPGLLADGVRLAANGVGGIIDINIRVRLFELLEGLGFGLPVLRHPRATVERSARLGAGVQVFASAYIGSSVVVHPKSMINTGAIVSHDCEIGAYTHIAPGALLAGHVHVGERALVGMGVTTAIGVKIGAGARIGNGAIIYADVADKTIVPAGKVWGG